MTLALNRGRYKSFEVKVEKYIFFSKKPMTLHRCIVNLFFIFLFLQLLIFFMRSMYLQTNGSFSSFIGVFAGSLSSISIIYCLSVFEIMKNLKFIKNYLKINCWQIFFWTFFYFFEVNDRILNQYYR